jgi:hypothetical protein
MILQRKKGCPPHQEGTAREESRAKYAIPNHQLTDTKPTKQPTQVGCVMEWIKDYTDSDHHPQMVAAGFWGRVVFKGLCRISGKFNLCGKLRPELVDGDYLAGFLGVPHIDDGSGRSPGDICSIAVERLIKVGLITRLKGGMFWIDGWDRKQPSANPESQRKQNLRDRVSRSCPVRVPALSQKSPIEVEVEVEVEVESEAKIKTTVAPEAGATSVRDSDQVFEYWKETLRPKARVFDDETRESVEERLAEGFSVEDLKHAIDGCKASPHHMGQNDKGKRYDTLELICRDGGHVQQFLGYLERPAQSQMVKGSLHLSAVNPAPRPPPGVVDMAKLLRGGT